MSPMPSIRLTMSRLLVASSIVVGPVAVMTIGPATAQEAPYGADPGPGYGEDPYGYGGGGGGNDPDPFQNEDEITGPSSTTTTTEAPAVIVAGETVVQPDPTPVLTDAGAGPVAEQAPPAEPLVAGTEEAKELPRTGANRLLGESLVAAGLMAVGLAARAAGRRRVPQA